MPFPDLFPVTARQLRPGTRQRRRSRPNAVHALVNQDLLTDDTPLTLHTPLVSEREALEPWPAANHRRALATWVNGRTRPIGSS